MKKIFCKSTASDGFIYNNRKRICTSRCKGRVFPFIRSDIDNGPDKASSAMAVVSALLYERFNTCKAPLAVVSMDNCSHNGEKLRNSITDMVGEWQKKRFC